MASVEWGVSHDISGLKIRTKDTWKVGSSTYEQECFIEYISGTAEFVELFVTGVSCGFNTYQTESGTNVVRYYRKVLENGKEQSTLDQTLNSNYNILDYNTMNEHTKASATYDPNYQKFSDVLDNLLEKWNDTTSDKKIYHTGASSNMFNATDMILDYIGNYGNRYHTENTTEIKIEYSGDCPIFPSLNMGAIMGVPDMPYTVATTVYNISESETTKNLNFNNLNDLGVYYVPRHYLLAHLLYDFDSFKDAPEPKPFFVENVATKIKYDGTKKASLIISHHFNLEEYQEFAEPTEVYKIPGYFINLAVNIRTVDPISGDNVNVYNLHKIDLPRDGFTKIAEVNDKGISKDYTYTYGDLVKACNNTVLSSPMKISVNIVQFANAVDGEPYVIYESPITTEIEINPVQHLYDGDTPASGITNSIEWTGYDGTDDGDNSGGDGKNDDKGDKSGTTGSGQGTHNVLTTTYVSNATRLQALGDFLWSSSFLDNILLVNNNPIENVISVKMFPFTLPTGAESTIVLGNVDTEVPTNKLPDNYNYYHVYGSVKVPSYYNSFMDYAPFTRILLYLPFYGTLELDNSLIIDRNLKIAYIVDVVTGACTIDIYADDSLINVISCQVGIDIPITSSNRAQVESAILSNTLTSAVSGASVGGGVGAVVGGVGGALLSAGHCKYTTQTSGTPSSATELYNVSVPMLIIDRPKYREISGFAHNKGKMCMLTKKLSDVSGFSIFDKNIDLSGIGCSETEMEMIRDLLSTGVYL